jgi:hypothetical protein
MRNKTFVPGFLYDFPHARAYKGGGAPTVQPPAYEPPNNIPAPPTTPKTYSGFVMDHIKTNRASGYYDDSWTDEAIAQNLVSNGYVKDPYTNPDDWVDPNAPKAPAPDAPVTARDGTLLSAPQASAPIPPVSDRSSEVQQAGREARRAAKKRRGLLSTFVAGETGGANNPMKTLLGQ